MGRKECVFSYPKYCPFRVTKLYPALITPDECREILTRHVGRNSTFFIEADARTSDIIRPKTLVNANKLDPTDQERLLNEKANAIKQARRVFIKVSTMRISRN